MKWSQTSQAYQDLFAQQINKKVNGNKTYIEIGANYPVKRSNTYNLEVNDKWTGLSVELNERYKRAWDKSTERSNSIRWCDAISLNYIDAIKQLNLPTHITYLSCDIEPVENTFKALQAVIGQGIKFDCITFEHDYYRSETDYREVVDNYLQSAGYKIAVYNVYFNDDPNLLFETWYVNQDINFDVIEFKDWKNNVDFCN
jgi:hypothetical protein